MSNPVKYRFLSLAVIAVMSLALAACGGDNTTSGNTTSGNTNMSNGDLLKAAATNMKSAKSYHIDVNGSSGGQQITMNGDLDVANNNTNLNITAAGQNLTLVSISNTAYISSDGGKTFTDMGSAGASVTGGLSQFTGVWSNFNNADVDKSASALKDGTPATDNINGTTCKHMTANASDLSSLSTSGGAASGTVDLWAAQDGAYVCQMKVTTTDSSTNLTIQWSKLNSVPAITAPANASAAPGGL